jgi:DNA-nicking Smr family endonuclease
MKKPAELSDHSLWDEVKRGVKPLGTGHKRASTPQLRASAGLSFRVNPTPVAPLHLHTPPPLSSFDRRTAQKLARGQDDPEARIDLHGHSLESARMLLLHFIEREQIRGTRLVLVITGKGASPYARHTLHGYRSFDAPEREGRLRREVPHWLNEALFRSHVVGFQPAHPRHGGGGALYVRLRRNRGLDG